MLSTESLLDGQTVIDEVKEIITLPRFNAEASIKEVDLDAVLLGPNVLGQLRFYISTVASMYKDNPFHSFEHASHVTMSVIKLLSRIVAPSDIEYNTPNASTKDDDELKRFRQLVVNSVIATDIMDKDLKELRNSRWDRAFQESAAAVPESIRDTVKRKAIIVIEHLIQASDVSHTMQHWHIYRKWNTRLFSELHKAYSKGRAQVNPADNWYKNEMGFFDFYIIPLAKTL
jgi:hypothetical protein